MPATNNENRDNRPGDSKWRAALYDIIFEADTPAGKYFDILLIVSILLSVLVVMLDSISSVRAVYGEMLYYFEWFFTILFTVEYFLRLVCVRDRIRYATSPLGIVDLVAIIPTYLSLFLPGSQFLLVIRVLRVLRIFRVLKLVHYVSEAEMLTRALRASRQKLTVFLFTELTLVVILGSLMYLIEGEENGFNSIPISIYWAIVTLTTVGFGDIVPQTSLGRALASVIMILGYSIIAVPTGIVTSEISYASFEEKKRRKPQRTCVQCENPDHDSDALFCKHCGTRL